MNDAEFIKSVKERLCGVQPVSAIVEFFEFILQPEYAAFHHAHPVWRNAVTQKCHELLMDKHDYKCERLYLLCGRFCLRYPPVKS